MDVSGTKRRSYDKLKLGAGRRQLLSASNNKFKALLNVVALLFMLIQKAGDPVVTPPPSIPQAPPSSDPFLPPKTRK